MADVVTSEKRSEMMAGIKDKNTRPEILIRKALHAKGFRYRVHGKKLPGKPDLVLPKYKTVVFVHGCFWHRHHCHLFKGPSTRRDFWKEKINGNASRDELQKQQLLAMGWKVIIIWECALKGKQKLDFPELVSIIVQGIKGENTALFIEIAGY